MKGVWFTGHQIADTVAFNLHKGLQNSIMLPTRNPELLDNSEPQFGYGVLRGMAEIMKAADKFFHLDKGYFNPGHFDGNYRISYKGTQAKWHEGIPQIESGIELEDWKLPEPYILMCPPTQEVCDFFGIDRVEWIRLNARDYVSDYLVTIRTKDCEIPLDQHLKDCAGVITFNSSVGWQALQKGIPCISDTTHSIVGSYYKHELDKKNLDYSFLNISSVDREPLFRAMRAHQFTLAEIREGKAWNLLKHYIQD